ncbi:MAG: response regulator [Spirochaetaceae bacterium]|jgi:putative two-component system response regulator|nr:response regulator [Spirochaetaceae bacterium]
MEVIRKKIMLVDDNPTNLTIGRNILINDYDVFTIQSGQKLFKILEKVYPDLILLDVEMPEMDGYEVIKQLKGNEQYRHIPVVFLTAKSDSGSELEGLTLGALDYITKPFSPPLLLKRIELHLLIESQKQELKNYNENLQELVNQKTRTVVELQNAVLQTVAEMVECRDDVTGGHIDRTQQYLQILTDALIEKNLYPEYEAILKDKFFVQSAQLHDVGKIAIQDSILKKPAKLTLEEYEEMKTHTTFGVKVIEKIGENTSEKTFLDHAKIFAGTHHEKWDGSGYPQGLKGHEIPLHGRLMAIADVYDALISERPYKKAFSHKEAVDIIAAGRGSHFDPELTDLFLSVADLFNDAATYTKNTEEEKQAVGM